MTQDPVLIFASFNREKLKEYTALLTDVSVTVQSLHEFDDHPPMVESGHSLSDNAAIKARAVAALYNLPAFSDDTGLEVFALDGAPGVYSSRYAGEGATYQQNMDKLLHELRNVPVNERGARFRTVICLCVPQANGQIRDIFFEGECEGFITTEPRGYTGFGYDPLFFVPSLNMTFAEAGEEMKNQASHRYVAASRLAEFLESQFPLLNIVEN